MDGFGEAFVGQGFDGVADGDATDAVLVDEVCLGGQPGS